MKTIQICLLVAFALGGNLLRAAITSYGGSHISPTSSVYQVSVRKAGDPAFTSIYVHNYWDTNGTGSETNIKFLHYAHFGASQADFDAGVEVEITYFENIVSGDTRVSPLAYGITPAIVGGNKLKFTLHDPKKHFVAINLPLVASMNTTYYNSHYLLMLMPELAEAVPSGSGVTTVTAAQGVSAVNAAIAAAPANGTVVMASGTYTGQVNINRSNVTLYLAPGAYLRQSASAVQGNTALKIIAGSQAVTVKGRGVIEAWSQVVDVKDCSNITIEGVIIRATGRQWKDINGNYITAGLAFWPQRTNDSFFRNLKVLRYPPSPRTADGIDPASCHNVAITDCMVYSGDDGICFKQEQNAEILYDNLLENNVTFTPTSGFKYGNTMKKTVDGDIWRNNYSVYGQLQFSNAGAENKDAPTITNQVVENITVENSPYAFLSIGVVRYDTPYQTDLDLVIDNLTVNKVWQTPPWYNTSEPNNPKINGYCGIYAKADPGKTINITFNNLKVEGDYIHNMAELVAKMGGNQPFVGGRSVDTDWTTDHPTGQGTVNVFFNVFTQSPPTAPTNLTATAVSSSEINLTWQHPSMDETGFDVQRDLDASFTAPDLVTDSSTGPGSNLSYQSSGLSPGTTYFYRVRAYNDSGPSAYNTPAVSATTDPTGGGTPGIYEAETLPTATNLAPTAISTFTEAGASPNPPNGANSLFVGAAVGDFITYTINVPVAGSYNVIANGVKYTSRAKCRLYVNGSATPLGAEMNLYHSLAGVYAYQEFDQGNVTLNAGNNTFKFQVSAQGAGGGWKLSFDYIKLTPQIANSVPGITTTTLPGTIAGESYSQALTATGGDGALVWHLDSGALPAGLSLSSAGVISGSATTAGTANFTVRVADSDSVTGPTDEDTQALSIVVSTNSVPGITTTTLPGTITGEAYSQTLTATDGNGALVWSLDSGSLPAGLNLSSAGVISGSTTTAGTANFTVKVADSDGVTGAGDEDTQALSIVVSANSVPDITTTTLPGTITGETYSQTLTATGGNGTLVWSLDSGSLPAGLSLSSAGVISGSAATAGTANFTVKVADSDGVTGAGDEDTQALSIVVTANSVPGITTTTLPDGTVGLGYSQTLAATGGDGTLVWTLDSGTLPAGLSLSAGGVISGTPTTAATSNFTVRVADSDGNTGATDEDTQALSITIDSSGGTPIVIDFNGYVAGATTSTDDSVGSIGLTGASGNDAVRFLANGPSGDWVQFSIPSGTIPAGTYAVSVRVRKANSMGKYQMSIDGANQGTEQNLYSSSGTFAVLDLGTTQITGNNNRLFKFTCAGKDSASSNYTLTLDTLTLTP